MDRLIETPDLWRYRDGEVDAMLAVVARPRASLDLLRADLRISHEVDRSEPRLTDGLSSLRAERHLDASVRELVRNRSGFLPGFRRPARLLHRLWSGLRLLENPDCANLAPDVHLISSQKLPTPAMTSLSLSRGTTGT
jgi:hypothetical protein